MNSDNDFNDKVRVYIAASSSEVGRAEHWAAKLEASGRVMVVSNWIPNVKTFGGNPADSTLDQQYEWAEDCRVGVENSDVIWVLMPQQSSMGAFWEFGFGYAYQLATAVSGGNQKASVFTSLAKYRFDTDEEAFDFIVNCTMNQLYGDLD